MRTRKKGKHFPLFTTIFIALRSIHGDFTVISQAVFEANKTVIDYDILGKYLKLLIIHHCHGKLEDTLK